MSQHDFTVVNDTAANVRTDINNALQALASTNAGASEPGTMFAYEFWADSSAGLLKQRNAANGGWIIRDTLAETRVSAVSGTATLAIGDFGKLIACSGTFTLNLTAAATMGDGWQCAVRNAGTGTITLDGSGSETIDGSATLALAPGEACLLICTGTAWYTVGRATASRSGQVVQAVEASPYTTYSSTASTFAGGDSKMTTASGAEILSVAITPTSATNRLLIEALCHLSGTTGTSAFSGLFQGATADALCQTVAGNIVTDGMIPLPLRHEMEANTTSSTTFKIRVAAGSGTLYVNGIAAGRRGGGNLACRLRVTEVLV